MKYLLAVLVVVLAAACQSKNYNGYICDYETKQPIAGVKVVGYPNSGETISDSAGFFLLTQKSEISGKLIFTKDGYKSDTVETVRSSGGEQLVEKFKGDTIYMFSVGSKFKDSVDRINRIEPTH